MGQDEGQDEAQSAQQDTAVITPAPFFIGKSAILAKTERIYESVEVPEWRERDGDGNPIGPIPVVRLRAFNVTERDRYERDMMEGKGRKMTVNTRDMRAKLVVLSVVTPDGNLMFTMQDVPAINQLGSAAVDRIASVMRRISMIDEDEIETVAKNLKSSRTGTSSAA